MSINTEVESTETDLVAEVEELLANAAHGPLTLIRYDHGGGRLYREEPRDLIADFYDAANRELHYAAPDLLRRLVQEVKRERDLRANAEEEIAQHNACDKCDLCEDHHA